MLIFGNFHERVLTRFTPQASPKPTISQTSHPPISFILTCHISIFTALVPSLFKTPTPTTSFNHAYVPFLPASNFPLNIVLPSGNGNPSVTTTMFAPSCVRIA
jgi:hypothetical protein